LAEDSPFCTTLTTGRFDSVANAESRTSPAEKVQNSKSFRAWRRDCSMDVFHDYQSREFLTQKAQRRKDQGQGKTISAEIKSVTLRAVIISETSYSI
jgi:hypothetical protein